MLFLAIEGSFFTLNLDSDELTKEITRTVEFLFKKLDKVCDSDRLEKQMKTLVLLLKPLEELIRSLGTQVKAEWVQKLQNLLGKLHSLFPTDKQTKWTPPNSLLDSYL